MRNSEVIKLLQKSTKQSEFEHEVIFHNGTIYILPDSIKAEEFITTYCKDPRVPEPKIGFIDDKNLLKENATHVRIQFDGEEPILTMLVPIKSLIIILF